MSSAVWLTMVSVPASLTSPAPKGIPAGFSSCRAQVDQASVATVVKGLQTHQAHAGIRNARPFVPCTGRPIISAEFRQRKAGHPEPDDRTEQLHLGKAFDRKGQVPRAGCWLQSADSPMEAATSASGSSWLDLKSRNISAVACRDLDHRMRSLGKCSTSRQTLLMKLYCCNTGPELCQRRPHRQQPVSSSTHVVR